MEQGKRVRISGNQKSILERFYQRGMVGVGKTYLEMIGNADQDTGLTTTHLEVYNISNKVSQSVASCLKLG